VPFSYAVRQGVTAALVANALKPSPNYRLGAAGFFPGWLTSELSLHLLGLTAADTARELTHGHRASKVGLVLGTASMAGLASMVAGSRHAGEITDRDLAEALGTDYRSVLADAPNVDPVTTWQQLAVPFRMKNPDVEIVRNVPYTDYGKRGLLDIYKPKAPTSDGAPVLLQVHGGAWYIGEKHQQAVPLMLQMAASGWVCVSINYRLLPRNRWPAHIVDVKTAIAWVREHIGEYGGDGNFIAITGGSAGGHLAALAALTPNDPEFQPGFEDADTTVQACVPHYGVYDFAGASGRRAAILMRDQFIAPRVLMRDPKTDIETFNRASPLLQVSPEAPPFYVLHGVNDTLVSVDQARDFVAALRQVSKQPVAYTELNGAQHAFDVFPSIRSQAVMKAVDRFLRWTYATTVAAAEGT
jgi:acetyl esterase/lipase